MDWERFLWTGGTRRGGAARAAVQHNDRHQSRTEQRVQEARSPRNEHRVQEARQSRSYQEEQQHATDTDQDNDSDEDENVQLPSTYAQKENPVTVTNGYIDGRSNSQAAFEERCRLLKEFHREYGHFDLPRNHSDPMTDYDEKYRILVSWMSKQRHSYRRLRNHPEEFSEPHVIAERHRVLQEEIGVRLNPFEDRWHELYTNLCLIKKKYGHCCVTALTPTSQDIVVGDPDEPQRVLPRNELIDFASSCRRSVKKYRQQNEQQLDDSAASSAAAPDNHADEEVVGAINPAMPNGDDEEPPDQSATMPPKKKRKQLKRLNCVSSWWSTQECYDLLCALKCPFIDSFDETAAATCGGVTKRTINTHSWYRLVEVYRKEIQEKEQARGTEQQRRGLLLASTISPVVKRLKPWAQDMRKLYQAVHPTEDGSDGEEKEPILESCRTYEHNFELLRSLDFCLDQATFQKEEERLAEEKKAKLTEEYARQREQASSAGKLRAAEKAAEEAKAVVSAVRKTLEQTKSELRAAEKTLREAKAKVKEARDAVGNDVVGKKVHVKPRGNGAPSGEAIVLSVHTVVVLGSELPFYNLEFIESGETAKAVDGVFVERTDKRINLLAAAAEQTLARPAGVVTRRRGVTPRKRKHS